MADTTTTQLVCPQCKSTDIRAEERLTSPRSIGSIGSWRIRLGYGVAIAVIAFGLIAILARRFVDPTMGTILLAIGVISFAYALYVLAGSLYAGRWARTDRYVCQECLYEWGPIRESPA